MAVRSEYPDLSKYKKKGSSADQATVYDAGSANYPSLASYQKGVIRSDTLDKSVLNPITDSWKSSWKYDMFDPGDVKRQKLGLMPKAEEAKYDLSNANDRWLYENRLPYSGKFSSEYQNAVKKKEEQQRQENAYSQTFDNFKKELYAQVNQAERAEFAAAGKEKRNATAVDFTDYARQLLSQNKYKALVANMTAKKDPAEYDDLAAEMKAYWKEREEAPNKNAFTLDDLMFEYRRGEPLLKTYLSGVGVTPPAATAATAAASQRAYAPNENVSEADVAKLNRLVKELEASQADSAPHLQTNPQTAIRLDAARREVRNQIDKGAMNLDDIAKAMRGAWDDTVLYHAFLNETGQVPSSLAVSDAAKASSDNATLAKARKELSEAKTAQAHAQYMRYLSAPDFADYSKRGADMSADKGNLSVNSLTPAGFPIHQYMHSDFNRRDLEMLTPEEVQVFNYLRAKEGQESADAFLTEIDGVLNRRRVEADAREAERLVREHPVAGSIYGSVNSVLANAQKGQGWFYGVGQALKGEDIDPYHETFDAGRYQSNIREAIGGQMGPVGNFFYQTGMSIADFLSVAPMGQASLVLMGTGAGADATRNALERGASDEQAIMAGTLAGAAEVIFEKVSLDKFLKLASPGAKGAFMMNALKQAGVEASEEFATEIANQLTDALIMGDLSNYNLSVQNYMQQGMSEQEATQRAGADMVTDVFLAALGGALSGGVTGAGGQLIGNIRTASIGKNAKDGGVVDESLSNLQAGQQYLDDEATYREAARAAFEQDVQSVGMDTAAAMRVYDRINARQSVSSKDMDTMTDLKRAVRHATQAQMEARADTEAARAKGIARLTNLYSAVKLAYEEGDFKAFNRAVAQYTAAIPEVRADISAQTLRAENKAQNAVYQAEDTVSTLNARTIEQTAADAQRAAQAAQDEARKARESVTPTRQTQAVQGRVEGGIIDQQQGGVSDGGQGALLSRPEIRRGILQGVEHARPQPRPQNTGDTSTFSGEPAAQPGNQAGGRGSDVVLSRGRGAVEKVARGLALTEQAQQSIQRHVETVERATGQKPDVRLVTEVDPQTAEILDTLKGITGSDAFLYESNDSFGNGWTDGNGVFVRVGEGTSPAFAYGHEIAHADGAINAAGMVVIDRLSDDKFQQYKAYRDAHISTSDNADIKRELVADAFGLFMHEATMGVRSVVGIGLDEGTIQQFYLAFSEALSAPELQETVSDAMETSRQMSTTGDAEYSRTDTHVRRFKDKVSRFIHEAIQNKGKTSFEKDKLPLWDIPNSLADEINRSSGGRIDVRGKRFALSANELWHEYNNHSDSKTEASRGQIPLTEQALNDILDVLSRPDMIEFIEEAAPYNLNRASFAMVKKVNGHRLAIELVGGKNNLNVETKVYWHIKNDVWENIMRQGKSIAEYIHQNNSKRNLDPREAARNKKERIFAMTHAPLEALVPTSETGSHSLRSTNNSIPNGAKNSNPNAEYSRIAFDDGYGNELSYSMPEIKERQQKQPAVKEFKVHNAAGQHIDLRSPADVGKQSVMAFSFVHSALRPYMKDMAENFLYDLDNGTRGERFAVTDAEGYQSGWMGVKRRQTAPITELLESGMSYADIEDGLKRIVRGAGRENTANAKRVELALDEALSKGYRNIEGERIPENLEYLQLKSEIPGAQPNQLFTAEELTFIQNAIQENIISATLGGDLFYADFTVDGEKKRITGKTREEVLQRIADARGEADKPRFYADFMLGGKKIHLEDRYRADLEDEIMRLKQEHRYKNVSDTVLHLRAASDMFRQGITVRDYLEGGKYNHEVGKQLRGMYIRNGMPQGGALSQQQLDTLTENLHSWKEHRPAWFTVSMPQRVLEELANWRNKKDPAGRAKNFLEGEALKDAYWGYVMTQSQQGELWKREQSEKILALKPMQGESTLTQMLGEGIITQEDVRGALYDGKSMVVQSEGATYVFDRRGRLRAMSSGGQLVFFDDAYYKRIKRAKKEIAKMIAKPDPKLSKDQHLAQVRKAEKAARDRNKPVAKDGSLSVFESGNSMSVTVKGTNSVIADIRNGKRVDVDRVNTLRDMLSDFYARVLVEQNLVLVENGYKPIPARKDYFPHMGRQASGVQAFISVLQGEPDALPTVITGLTKEFTPGKPFVTHMLERMGGHTEYDAIRGFNKYLRSASDLIHFTPVIQRVRQLEKFVRENSVRSENSALANWLHNYGNTLANKKSDLDRAMEDAVGREAYTVLDKLTGWFGAASVAGNVSSALSNVISFLSSLPGLDPRYVGKGVLDTMRNGFAAVSKQGEYDGFADKIPMLSVRFGGYEDILTRPDQKAWRQVNHTLGLLFQTIDRFAVESAARAKYTELMAKGIPEQETIRRTNDFLMKVFADRGKGLTPALFNKKIMKSLGQFQLEPLNQLSHFRDLARQGTQEQIDNAIRAAGGDITQADWSKLKGLGAKELGRVIAYLLLMSLWGGVTRELMGRDQAINPIGMGKDFARDLEQDGAGAAMLGLVENVADALPFLSMLTDGGRVPFMGGLESIKTAGLDIVDPDISTGQKAISVMQGAASFIPGGAQASKSIRGAVAVANEGAYSKSGKLRYPVPSFEQSPWDATRAFLFGPAALAPEGFDYQKDTLSEAKTEKYKELREEGYSQQDAYQLLRDVDLSAPYFGQVASIATHDHDNDGVPDFSEEEINHVADMLGIKIPKNKTAVQYVKDGAETYIKKQRKDEDLPPEKLAEKEGYTAETKSRLSEYYK